MTKPQSSLARNAALYRLLMLTRIARRIAAGRRVWLVQTSWGGWWVL